MNSYMKPLLIVVAILGMIAGIIAPAIDRYVPKQIIYSLSATAIGVVVTLIFRSEQRRRKEIKQKIASLFVGRHTISSEEFGTKYFTGRQCGIATALINQLKPYFPFDGSRIQPDDRIHEDLELRYWDDLADVDIVRWLEKTYQISFNDEETTRIHTIRQLVEATDTKMTVQPGVVADGHACISAL